jgi:hypothetical protein
MQRNGGTGVDARQSDSPDYDALKARHHVETPLPMPAAAPASAPRPAVTAL